MKYTLFFCIFSTLNLPTFVLAGRIRDRILKIVDLETVVDSAPLQKAYKLKNVAITVQAGSLNGQGYDEVLVRFQSMPKKLNDEVYQSGNMYFLAMRPCDSPKSKFENIFETPIETYEPGHRAEVVTSLPTRLPNLAMEFRFGHKNSTHDIGYEDINSVDCESQLKTGQTPLYVPPFKVYGDRNQENGSIYFVIDIHGARYSFDNNDIPKNLTAEVYTKSCKSYSAPWTLKESVEIPRHSIPKTGTRISYDVSQGGLSDEKYGKIVRLSYLDPKTGRRPFREVWAVNCDQIVSKSTPLDLALPPLPEFAEWNLTRFGVRGSQSFEPLSSYQQYQLFRSRNIRISNYRIYAKPCDSPDFHPVAKLGRPDPFADHMSASFSFLHRMVGTVKVCAVSDEGLVIVCASRQHPWFCTYSLDGYLQYEHLNAIQ